MFIQKSQSHDGKMFQDQLLKVYKTSKYQSQSIHVRYFFQKIWKLASAESVDPEVKEIDKNVCDLSPERVYKALFLASKALQNNNHKFFNHTVWDEIDFYPITLRKVFEELRTASHYFRTKGYNPPFVTNHKLPNKFANVPLDQFEFSKSEDRFKTHFIDFAHCVSHYARNEKEYLIILKEDYDNHKKYGSYYKDLISEDVDYSGGKLI